VQKTSIILSNFWQSILFSNNQVGDFLFTLACTRIRKCLGYGKYGS